MLHKQTEHKLFWVILLLEGGYFQHFEASGTRVKHIRKLNALQKVSAAFDVANHLVFCRHQRLQRNLVFEEFGVTLVGSPSFNLMFSLITFSVA
jgi:hypothetical protein